MQTCEARVGQYISKGRESSFHQCGGSVKLVEARSSDKNDRESSFHHGEGAVKFVQAYLSA